VNEIFGYISLGLYMLALAFEDPRKTFWCSNIATAFFIAQCVTIGMFVTAFGPLCLMGMTVFILKTKSAHWKSYVKAYAVLFALAGVIMAGQGSELFAVAGSCCSAFSRLGRDQFYVYRSLSSFGNIFWFFSAYLAEIQSFMIMSAMLVIINAFFVARYTCKHQVHLQFLSQCKQCFHLYVTASYQRYDWRRFY
jgi:hypothetical protein